MVRDIPWKNDGPLCELSLEPVWRKDYAEKDALALYSGRYAGSVYYACGCAGWNQCVELSHNCRKSRPADSGDYGFESGKVPGMENSEENASQPVPPDIFNRPDDHDPEAPYTTRFFIVRLDEEGNVTDVSTDFIASVTQTEAEEFARKVLNEKRQVGYYKNYRFQILAKKMIILLYS